MNSFQELNNFNTSQTIEFPDNRPADVFFDREIVTNYFLDLLEGQTHTIPVGIEITEIVNYQLVAVTYTIDLTDNPGATATWDTLPDYIDIDNTTSDVYVVSGLRSAFDWNLVKSPTITMPNNYFGEWSYTAKITYIFNSELQSKFWTVGLAVTESDALSEASEFIFDISSTQLITGNPSNIDTGTQVLTYTITVTPSVLTTVDTMSSAGTGGSSSFNNTTKVLTITGTLEQTNSHLDSITLVSTAVEEDFTLTYSLTSSLGENDIKVQSLRARSILYLGPVVTVYYDEDVPFVNSGIPLVTDLDEDGLGTYTYTITPSFVNAINTMSSTGSGGTSSFNNTTKVLTLTGTRNQVNSHLANVSIIPGADFASNFNLTFDLTTPTAVNAVKLQNILIDNASDEVSNIAVNRSVWTSTLNSPFATTDYLIEQTQYGGSYTRESLPYLVTNGLQVWNDGGPSDTVVPRYGTACLQFGMGTFDSEADSVTFTPAEEITLNDFTFETWYLGSFSSVPGPYDSGPGVIFDSHENNSPNVSSSGLAIWLGTDSTAGNPADVRIYINGNDVFYKGIFNADEQWHHIAISRTGSTVRVFNDGTQIGSFTNSTPITLRNTDGFRLGNGRGIMSSYVGGNTAINLSSQDLRAYLDDTRISNSGIYTSNFTPGQLSRSPYSLLFFNWDGGNQQWPPNAPISLGGLPQTITQTTPQIVDVDTTDPTYTISFSCPSSYGIFNLDGVSSTTISFTGTKQECNVKFSQIIFYLFNPTNGLITYTQRKNNVTQVTQSIQFIGSEGQAE